MPWENVEFKLNEARFYLDEMGRDLAPPSTQFSNLSSSPGTLVTGRWQPQIYYHFDGFLAAARSVPDIIQAWFGVDHRSTPNPWLQTVPPGEEQRRRTFQDQFRPLYQAFHGHPLSRARVLTVHRRGIPPVTVQVSAHWGVYQGGPTTAIPSADVPPGQIGSDPAEYTAVISCSVIPLEPRPTDFSLEQPSGTVLPLFSTCEGYLQDAQRLADDARRVYDNVHRGQPVTPPPDP